MPPPGVKPAATRKSITNQLLAGNIPRAQARAAIESGEIDGAIAALVNNQAPAQANVLLELLGTRYRRTADRARVIEALTASGGAYLAAAHWLDTQGHLRSVS